MAIGMDVVVHVEMRSTRTIRIPVGDMPDINLSEVSREDMHEIFKFADDYADNTEQKWVKHPHLYTFTVEPSLPES